MLLTAFNSFQRKQFQGNLQLVIQEKKFLRKKITKKIHDSKKLTPFWNCPMLGEIVKTC